MKNPLVLLLLFAIPCFASPKKHEFKGSIDQVFDAAVTSAQTNWSVKFADRQTHTLSFTSGVSLTTNGMECSASIRQIKDGQIEVTLRTQKKFQIYAWSAGDRIADKFFKGIGHNLAESTGSDGKDKKRGQP